MPRIDHQPHVRSEVPGLRQHLRKIFKGFSEVADRKARETSVASVESVQRDRENNCSNLISDL
jgi:hypothetical protein